MIQDILKGLDPVQRKAVEQMNGPVLIVAGAGSGKTRVLTSRIAYMLEMGVDPSRILALTFTKKAAGEMKDRISQMVGQRKAWRLAMGTFHSVFIRFLREYASVLGYPSTFTIYDTSDSETLLKRIIKEKGLDEKTYKVREVRNRISAAKNNLVTPKAYRNNPAALEKDRHSDKPKIVDIYEAYQNAMKASGVMDFDDILLNMNILLVLSKDACRSISERFDYILVDEYQDTNMAQYIILKTLSKTKKNICVVGDDSQSIYGFRGARIENILNFRRDFPSAVVFRLERNYRSTRNIVSAANSVIEKNQGRIEKKCFSEGEDGAKIHIIHSADPESEARDVVSSISSRLMLDKAAYSDFAILYRTNAQSKSLEEALRRRNIPYRIYSGNSFFERAEVKDMISYMKLTVNHSDDESFRRVVNKPARAIGDTSVQRLSAVAKKNGKTLFEAAYLDDSILMEGGLRGAAIGHIRSFCEIISKATAASQSEDAYAVAALLADSSGLYVSYRSDTSVESQSRAANIEELVNSAKIFVDDARGEYIENYMADHDEIEDIDDVDMSSFKAPGLSDFLENIALLTAVDSTSKEEDASNKVAMMTVHTAKGLEFPFVYITGMEEELFPTFGVNDSPSDLEEERRLFYVALTRAEKAAVLSFADRRMRMGEYKDHAPSRFIREIDPKYIDNPLSKEDFEIDDEEGLDDPYGWGYRGRGYGSSGYGRGEARYGKAVSDRYSAKGAYPQKSSFSRPSSQSASKPAAGASSNTSIPKGAKPLSQLRPSSPGKPSQPRHTDDSDFTRLSPSQVAPGTKVEHNRFGYGTIESVSKVKDSTRVKILFDNGELKEIILEYAKMRLA